MRYARLILACLIALSVAALPAGAVGAFAAVAKSADLAISSSMPDCCDHEMPPCDHPGGDTGLCGAMAGCMAKCFSYVGTSSPGALLARVGAVIQPNWIADLVLLNIGSPPFRPPRL
jgi:hypothetical protein